MSTPVTSPGTSIVDNNALTGALRTLKLGGMLQTLDARLAQARAGELGHLEFLQHLRALSRPEAAGGPTRDTTAERAAFLARKADLFARIAAAQPGLIPPSPTDGDPT